MDHDGRADVRTRRKPDRAAASDSDIRDGWSAASVRAAEAVLLGVGEPLMRRAAAGLARELRRERDSRGAERVVLLCGSGDNGGDGLYAVAELAAAGVDAVVVPTGRRFHADGMAAAERSGARRVGNEELPAVLAGAETLVVDAMVGIGASGSTGLRAGAGAASAAVRAAVARRERLHVIAVDVPSGLEPDTGHADDSVLRATITVTFGAVKAGLLWGRGPELAGEVRLIDIGLGPALRGEPLVHRGQPAPAPAPR